MREGISIRLSKELKVELERFAETRGVTRSDVVREAVADSSTSGFGRCGRA